MNLNEIEIGQQVTYYPPPQDSCQIPHFPAVVEKIGKRVKVTIFMAGAESGISKFVSAKRLAVQNELTL